MMEELQQHLSKIRIPQASDQVYKDECVYSFDSPDSPTGLYVCLNSFLGFGRDHVEAFSNGTGNRVFLHRTRTKTEVSPPPEAEPEKKIARLAIGVTGGFDPDAGARKWEYCTTLAVVVLPAFTIINLPCDELPELVSQSVAAVERAEGALQRSDAEAGSGAGAWDGEVRQVTKHADNLQQLANGIKIPPSGWQCGRCEKTDNLWLNLTDGSILCGRRQLDGSGGNNHAADHFQDTGHPLSVKLGTITAEGKADVFSYTENDMVLDPNLVDHLAHWGINTSVMEKTEKTMAELEIDFNQRAWEYSRLTESGNKLVPMFGAGYTGLCNLGNSCYLNSVVQVLATVPSIVNRYYTFATTDATTTAAATTAATAVSPERMAGSFDGQMTKLMTALLSGKYSPAPSDWEPDSSEEADLDTLQPGVAPTLFRRLVGRGHTEFSSARQQDAMEYLDHLLKMVERSAVKQGVQDPGHCFKFQVEDKFVCSVSGRARYVKRSDLYMPLPVLLSEATNIVEVQEYKRLKEEAKKEGRPFDSEPVRHLVPFSSCLEALAAPETLTAFSAAARENVPMTRTTRLCTFPEYLFVQLVKFGVTESWEAVKHDVSVACPEVLDLSLLRSTGPIDGELLMPDLPDEQAKEEAAAPVIDEAVVQQLQEMGFAHEGCRRAVHMTGNCGSDAAINWIMEHMGDEDFAKPFVLSATAGQKKSASTFTPCPDGLSMLQSMGFTDPQASLALQETNNNLERAADWLFSRQPELDQLVAAAASGAGGMTVVEQRKEIAYTDGDPIYELTGFISHMGTSIHVGHYVCHIKKDGHWTIFNDNKVSKSVNPPTDLGYIYLYKRITPAKTCATESTTTYTS